MTGRRRGVAWLLLLEIMLASVRACGVAAAESDRKISVSANGLVSVKPDIAEIRAAVFGSATIAEDALKKYRSSRSRAIEVLGRLKFKDLKVEGNGPALVSNTANNNQQNVVFVGGAVVNGQQQEVVTPNITEVLVIRLPLIDRMPDKQVIESIVKVVDALKDIGVAVVGVQFKSTKLEAARTAAIRAAMESARQKAEMLAGVSHTKVGPVVSIRETLVAGASGNEAENEAGPALTNGLFTTVEPGPATMSLTPITVKVAFDVDFALEKGK